MGGHNHRLAPGQAMARGKVARAPALLEELLDQAQGNTETVGHLAPSALVVVIRSQDSFPQIK